MGIKRAYSLKSQKKLTELMASGSRVKAFPIHMVFKISEPNALEYKSVQLAYSAPKRIHRNAVDRNPLKRAMREASRPFVSELETLMENSGISIAIMLIYVGKEKEPYAEIARKIKILLSRLEEQVKSLPKDEEN